MSADQGLQRPASMELLKGVAVSAGVAIAPATVLDTEDFRIVRRTVPQEQVPAELEALDQAIRACAAEITALRDGAVKKVGPEVAALFNFHLAILTDPKEREQLERLIREQRCSAAYAVHRLLQGYRMRFAQMRDPIFRERLWDIKDVEDRLLRKLLGEQRERLPDLKGPTILIARDLTPSQTVGLDPKVVIGLATDAGGATSHTAIIAHTLRLPAVVGLGRATEKIREGDTVVVDGTHGLLIARPDPPTLRRYQAEAERYRSVTLRLQELRDLPAETRDGVHIVLLGNIEFPREAKLCIEQGAEGIGLYRTEFLLLQKQRIPTEEDHYEAYREAAEACGDRILTIRTLDLGGDKYQSAAGGQTEANPFLGLRSIRYSLQNLGLFKAQLRAILRASAHGNVRVMFPLITGLMELRQAKMALGDAMEDLEEQGIPFNRNLPVGMMVETPAAALMCRQFAREVDFFSIGTNDLVQYMLAVDRSNQLVAPLYTPAHPAVLRLLRETIRTANRLGVEVSLCGEMGGDPLYTMLLIGLGLRRFSMAAGDIPEVKKIVREVTVADCERVAARALTFDTDRQVTTYLREELRKVLPEISL